MNASHGSTRFGPGAFRWVEGAGLALGIPLLASLPDGGWPLPALALYVALLGWCALLAIRALTGSVRIESGHAVVRWGAVKRYPLATCVEVTVMKVGSLSGAATVPALVTRSGVLPLQPLSGTYAQSWRLAARLANATQLPLNLDLKLL